MEDITAYEPSADDAANHATGPTSLRVGPFAKWLAGVHNGDVAYGEPLQVDISDPNAIKDALTRAEREVDTREARVRAEVEALRYWQTMRSRLVALADGNGADVRLSGGETVRHRVLRLVNESPVPIDVDHAQQVIPVAKRKTLSWTLWDLERKKEIQKIADGLYASLDYEPSTLLGGSRN